MAGVVAGADAVADGLRDLVELAAPQPIVVVEIGIALGAAAAGAVARRAIVGEGRRPRARAKSSNCGSDSICCSEADASFAIIGPRCGLQLRELRRDRAARVPVEQALAVGRHERPGRIDDPVADRPDDRGVEQPQPPARQRRVQFPMPSHSWPVVPTWRRGFGAAFSCSAMLSPPAAAGARPRRIASGATATAHR